MLRPYWTALESTLSIELFIVIIFLAAVAAGLLGALAGLGGGILIVPLLTIGFGFDIRTAIGASIVSVIATSSGAGATYVGEHLTNVRVAVFLEVATTAGAVCGAALAGLVTSTPLFILFGLLLLGSATQLIRERRKQGPVTVADDGVARYLKLASSYPDEELGREVSYRVTGVPLGFGMMIGAGLASGLLGIGSGALKVFALESAMRLPLKVSTATSNFMIGVTAAASAGIYYWRGDVLPLVAAPVGLGVLAGSMAGARLLERLRNTTIQRGFLVTLVVIAIEMLMRGLGVA